MECNLRIDVSSPGSYSQGHSQLQIYPYAHITIINIEYTNKYLQKICIVEFIINIQNEGDHSQNSKSHAAVRTCFKQRFRG